LDEENALAALVYAERALERDPDLMLAQYVRGAALWVWRGDYANALADIDAVIGGILELTAFGVNYEPYLLRAQLHMSVEDYDLALPDLQEAAMLRPDIPEVWRALGDLYLATDRTEEMNTAYTEYVDISISLGLAPDAEVLAILARSAVPEDNSSLEDANDD
ncbi:MAG: tetratricopeptide repeat protein, partial [Chloroflexota bacterium]